MTPTDDPLGAYRAELRLRVRLTAVARRTLRAPPSGHAVGMALLLALAGASYGLASALSAKFGPRRPD